MRHRALPSLVVAIPLLVVACSGAPPRPPSERYMADVSNTLSGPRTIVIQRRLRLVTPYSKNTCFRNPKIGVAHLAISTLYDHVSAGVF